jgi:hypothetical protein
MVKRKKIGKKALRERPTRALLTADECLKRLEEFSKRKRCFVAAVREGRDRNVSA